MFVRKIRLSNYCQHEELDRTLAGNLVAVIGRNGTGKSNLLGSLQFAFTGMVPDVDKSALLRDGATEGEVTVDFEHNGMPCVISRRLDCAEANLEVPGNKPVSGVKAVNAAIAELLGLDNDLARQSVFVRQGELDSIIFAEPAVRERSWQAMVGLGSAAKVYSQLGQCLSLVPERRELDMLLAEATTELCKELLIYHSRAIVRDSAKAALRQHPAPDADRISKLHMLCGAASSCATLTMELTAADANRDSQHELLVAANGQLSAMADATKELTDARTRMSELELAWRTYTEWTGLVNKVKECNIQIADMEAKLAGMDTAQALEAQIGEAHRLIATHSGLQSAYTSLRQALLVIPTAGMVSCPVCDSALSDTSASVRRLTALIERMAAEIVEMQAAAASLLPDLTKRKQLDGAVSNLRQECAVLSSKITGMSGRISDVSAETVTTQDGLVRQLEVHQRKRIELLAQVKFMKERYQAAVDRGINLQADLAQTEGDRRALEGALAMSAEQALQALERLRSDSAASKTAQDEFTRAETDLAAARALARRLIKTLRQLRKEDAAQNGLRQLYGTVEAVRNWFHFSQGPRMVVTDILDRLTPDINALLAKFGSPYTVIPDYDNVLFKYVKGAGASSEPQSVLRLSGGERVMLATSFRIASYCMFASKLGLLTLDEPTVYLDSQNVQLFSHLVEKLRGITAAMHIQLFMSTHEESIIPLCDTVINLNEQTNQEH